MYGDNNAPFLRNIITIISKNTLHRTDSSKIVVLETFKHVDISTKADFSFVMLSVATASAIFGMHFNYKDLCTVASVFSVVFFAMDYYKDITAFDFPF